MPNVTTPLPDFKVFFRRLLIPGELNFDPNVVLTPSQIAGSADVQNTMAPTQQQIRDAFASYQPAQFQKQVMAKATQVSASYEARLAAANTAVANIPPRIKALNKQLAGANPKTGAQGFTLTTTQLTQLQTDIAGYPGLLIQMQNYSPFVCTTPSPLSLPQARIDFSMTLNNVNSIDAMVPVVRSDILGICSDLMANLTALISSQASASSLSDPEAILSDVIVELNALNNLVGVSSGALKQITSLEQQIAILGTQLQDAQADLLVLNQSSAIQPFYDPILLDCLLGPYSVQTSMNRKGQPGTGSVTFHLPLAANGQAPDLFFGLQVNDVFNMDNLEKQISSGSTKTRGSAVPGRTLSILTANMRECILAPFDMMQVWARRRYTASANFPADYYPIFTGFITKTDVSYAGATVTVKVSGEDVGRMVRLARINVDPQLDTSLNDLGLSVSAFSNSLIALAGQPNNKTGGQMIQNIIQGQTGMFLGMSNAAFVATTANVKVGSGTMLVTASPPAMAPAPAKASAAPAFILSNQPTAIADYSIPGTASMASVGATASAITKAPATTTTTTTLGTQVVNLAWDFKNIQVNIFNDLVNNWPPYATQLKSAFRMWETDDLTKWEVCSQIAEVQEFEFYADNMGVINYHPPLYYLNPFAPQYYIEDTDIISEAHSVNETKVVTVMELDTQPSFVPGQINPVLQGRAFIPASTPVLQRYAVRYQKKSSPIFSDTTPSSVFPVGPSKANQGPKYNIEEGRASYCRALLNRRNAELKSAMVTINGTPELRLCNTIAFVGNLGAALQSVSLNPFAPLAPGAAPSPTVPNSVLTSLQQMLVYYISNISHNYTQGKDFTTTLELSHGRHWTDALPSGNVGYGVSGPETNETCGAMRQYYGQGDATLNAKNFIGVASAKLNFISTGNPAALGPTTSSQFGFTSQPVKPSPVKSFLTTLSAAVSTSHVRSWYCNKLSKTKDPKRHKFRLKDELNSALKAAGQALLKSAKAIYAAAGQSVTMLKNLVGKSAKMIAAYAITLEAYAVQEAEAIAQEAAAILSDPVLIAFKAYLGDAKYKFVLKQTFPDGTILQKTGAAAFLAPLQQAGIDTTPITSFKFPIAIYVYVAQSPISDSDALIVAARAVLADLPKYLGNVIKGVPDILTYGTLPIWATDRNHISMSIPTLPALPPMPSFASILKSVIATPPPVSATTPFSQITSLLTATAQVDAPFNYTITGTNSPTSFTAAGLPSGLTLNPKNGVISGTPTSGSTPATATTVASAGTINVQISAINAGGLAVAPISTLVLTVLPSATAPQEVFYKMGFIIGVIDPTC